MKRKVANYTVIFEKERRTGTDKECWVALVPILGVATEADSLEEAEKEIKALVRFHLESLASENEEIPIETKQPFLSRFETSLPRGARTLDA